ncbi:hypothetical protein [Stenomitos frigidus]|uniref:Uncharacterized protein n=1 Tax=Stenomitos frigidus ULC18 TaxID=2107698 RepID=A0A2T1DVQ0_9CYAN|nr:hypothetical protein [Stenomitos frigidus]PSB24511.1 hypothetical protein C7B82_26090 [Stenomitos frigidus ULC18]
MTSKTSEDYILPPDSIKAIRYAVYFESEWLWKEKNPVRRANASRRLAELTAKLADLEAEEAQNFVEQTVVDEVA